MLNGEFIKKLKHYEEDYSGELLGVRLCDVYKESYNELSNHLEELGVNDEKTKYLIEQLIEDRDYLNAFTTVTRGK